MPMALKALTEILPASGEKLNFVNDSPLFVQTKCAKVAYSSRSASYMSKYIFDFFFRSLVAFYVLFVRNL